MRALEVRAGTGFVELDLTVSALVAAEQPPPNRTESEAAVDVLRVIREYATAGGIWLFAEAQHWLDEDGRPSALLNTILSMLDSAGTSDAGKLAVFTSTRHTHISGDSANSGELRSVRGLSPDFGIALLRAHGAEAAERVLERVPSSLMVIRLRLRSWHLSCLVMPGLTGKTFGRVRRQVSSPNCKSVRPQRRSSSGSQQLTGRCLPKTSLSLWHRQRRAPSRGQRGYGVLAD